MHKYWFKLNDKIRFLIVGCFNAGVAYLLYSIICLCFGETIYQTALALSWIITSVTSFITQRFLVFEGKGIWYKEYIKCCATWFISYLINAGLLEFTVKYIHMNVFIAQLISNFLAAVFTYLIFKNFVFKKAKIKKSTI